MDTQTILSILTATGLITMLLPTQWLTPNPTENRKHPQPNPTATTK